MKKLILLMSLSLVLMVSCNSEKKEVLTTSLEMSEADKLAIESQKTLDIANAFMGAMGKGDMATMKSLMHDDMVWHNEGDKNLPWIGPWNGKKVILEGFLPKFGANLKTTKWESIDGFANGDTAAFFGKMKGLLVKSNQETDEFTYALRVKVKDGKVILWNWLEDSYDMSKAYHGLK